MSLSRKDITAVALFAAFVTAGVSKIAEKIVDGVFNVASLPLSASRDYSEPLDYSEPIAKPRAHSGGNLYTDESRKDFVPDDSAGAPPATPKKALPGDSLGYGFTGGGDKLGYADTKGRLGGTSSTGGQTLPLPHGAADIFKSKSAPEYYGGADVSGDDGFGSVKPTKPKRSSSLGDTYSYSTGTHSPGDTYSYDYSVPDRS